MAEQYNKVLYRLILVLVKYLPFIIGVATFISAIYGCYGIQLMWIPNLFFMSPTTALFMVLVSFLFKCCIWHRLPIYYSLLIQIFNIIDYYCKLPITNNIMLFIYLAITILFILIGMYLKNRYNKLK